MSGGEGAFLAEDKLRELIREGGIIESKGKKPEDIAEQVKQWSYDLHLGDEAFLSTERSVRSLVGGRDDSVVIQPGEFGLLITEEKVNFPLTHVAFISLKFRYALKGLINISGFHVDPGYQGKLVLSVYNAGPNSVVIRRGDPVFMFVLAILHGTATARDGSKYQGITQLTSEMISSVKGPAVSLTALNRKVERMEGTVSLLIGLIVAMLATLIVTILVGR